MEQPPFHTIGRIVKTHGVKGEVSFAPASGLPLDVLEGLDVWVVPPTLGIRATRVLSVRPGPKGPLLTLAGIESVDVAAELRGRELSARSSDVPDGVLATELDMVDWEVVDVKRGVLGRVADVIVTGANDVLVVEGGPFGQVCVPVIDDVVEALDEDTRTATVRLLPGLIDEEEDQR
jgi:16S rRNA processing protein RimM